MIMPMVEMTAVTKEYRGMPAVKGVNFTVMPSEVHALLGENGAGKSTLTKIIAGVTRASAGSVKVDGREGAFRSPAEALANGVAMVFQETSLVPSMTVARNLYLGNERLFNRLCGLTIAAQQFLQKLNFNADPLAMVANLGAAQKQMVEIARAVLQKARLIIFDEPTATLTPEEKRYFFALLQRLKRDGVAVVVISHAIEKALMIADRITILRDGELVVTDRAGAFDRDKIIQAMVGRTLSGALYQRHDSKVRPAGAKVLSVQNLSMGAMVRNTSFTVYAGQVTGVFGLIGSGRTEAAKIVAGLLKRNFFHGGEVLLEDRPITYRLPRDAVLDKVVYVTTEQQAGRLL